MLPIQMDRRETPMKVAAVKAPGGLDKLVIESRAEPVAKPGQILVRVFASSLNFHDLAVVSGRIKTDDGRIPMSDGAGEVVDVGEGASSFKKGDQRHLAGHRLDISAG
jgi:NADPH:quinone reductase-like Zn-dependent oxidoreductase